MFVNSNEKRKEGAGFLSQAIRRSRGKGKPSLPSTPSESADDDRSDSDEDINDYRHKRIVLRVKKMERGNYRSAVWMKLKGPGIQVQAPVGPGER